MNKPRLFKFSGVVSINAEEPTIAQIKDTLVELIRLEVDCEQNDTDIEVSYIEINWDTLATNDGGDK